MDGRDGKEVCLGDRYQEFVNIINKYGSSGAVFIETNLGKDIIDLIEKLNKQNKMMKDSMKNVVEEISTGIEPEVIYRPSGGWTSKFLPKADPNIDNFEIGYISEDVLATKEDEYPPIVGYFKEIGKGGIYFHTSIGDDCFPADEIASWQYIGEKKNDSVH